ncbi:1-phosphofructokinase family hexose kinase [Glutamicibacter sp. V16R2B1]|uniref:1-phosphofructokinase family hexose kinase n=1 Tax=Glutamicibacter sp. V16R2B1 TaxID=2036207 RepID=UPI0010FF39A1|nr:1-phosphofructokinase family hexose kinase [Glutamicibacter sp. V16R2B1]TLK53545.1 1-phosphofructokinase family hexose kinase [Glutamicibacter sp. V16R2B1]
MILTLTPNPAIDESYQVPGITLDTSHRVPMPLWRAGGKGINVARVLEQLGYRALALFPSGGTSGEALCSELRAAHLAHHAVPVSGQTRRSMAFHDPQANTTTLFNQSGEPLRQEDIQALENEFIRLLPTCRAVTINGSWPPHTPADLLPRLITAARRAGVWVLADASGEALLQAARAGAVLKPNEHELREATGCSSLSQGARQLLELGAPAVFASAGADGLYHFAPSQPVTHALLPQALSGNPTGAGDSAVAALAASALQGLEIEPTLRRAVAWSAATVLMPTAGAVHPSYQQLAREVICQTLSTDAHH